MASVATSPKRTDSTQDSDPTLPNNKHLTRLVRFSILQARRMSQQQQASKTREGEASGEESMAAEKSTSRNYSPTDPPAGHEQPPRKPTLHIVTKPEEEDDDVHQSGLGKSFSEDKERPTTEVPYEYRGPGHVNHVVNVSTGDPPIMEDLSASLTMSGGEQSQSQSNDDSYNSSGDYYDDDEGATAREDMDMLLAPDSGSNNGLMVLNSNGSHDVYNSAEMYSSSGNYYYDNASQASSSDSSDSIMRRVEQEIANARKASSAAQARLAYFTSQQGGGTSSAVAESYSFDFESLETNGDLQTMLDVGGDELELEPQKEPATDEYFENAMGDIDQEFDAEPPVLPENNKNGPPPPPPPAAADVGETVDIEVVLAAQPPRAPSSRKNGSKQSPRKMQQISPLASPNMRTSPRRRGGAFTNYGSSPRRLSNSMDDADIPNVLTEQSIESLPTHRESIQNVFSENSIDSLPTQANIERPGSFSFQDSSHAETDHPTTREQARSPSKSPSKKSPTKKSHNMLPPLAQSKSKDREGSRTPLGSVGEGDRSFKSPARSVLSPTQDSRLPTTPREPGTPSYRERLESKLKILGSRYPVSPNTVKGVRSPSSAGTDSDEKKEEQSDPLEELSESDSAMEGGGDKQANDTAPQTPRNTESTYAVPVSSPLGEAYDGLENRIKDLLARTLKPASTGDRRGGDKESDFGASPSSELKAIKKLLDDGASASAAEGKKKTPQAQSTTKATKSVPASSSIPDMSEKGDKNKNDPLAFPALPELNGKGNTEKSKWERINAESEEALKATTTNASENGSVGSGRIHLRPRSSAPDSAKTELAQDSKPVVPEPVELGSKSNPISVVSPTHGDPLPKEGAKSKSEADEEVSDVKCTTSKEILEELDAFSQAAEFISTMSSPSSKVEKQKDVTSLEENTSTNRRNADTTSTSTQKADTREKDGKQKNAKSVGKMATTAPLSPATGETWVPPLLSPKKQNSKLDGSDEQFESQRDKNRAQSPVKKSPSVINALNAALSRPSPKNGESKSKHQNFDATPAQQPSETIRTEGSRKPDTSLTMKDAQADSAGEPTKSHKSVKIAQGNTDVKVSASNNTLSGEVTEKQPQTSAANPSHDSRATSNVPKTRGSAEKQVSIRTRDKAKLEKKQSGQTQDRKIRFRDPYPTPKPCRKPRSTEDIKKDYSCKPTHAERKTKWKEPKGDLKRLLDAATDPSLPRRSNACGALKVISKLDKNKVVLVRTTGFLDALVFVAGADMSTEEIEVKEEARARAISCIYNLSHMKENRFLICTHPGLLHCLVKTINEDRGEARAEACGIMAQLAKSPSCREYMAEVDELLSTLACVLRGTIDPAEKMMDVLSDDISEGNLSSSFSEASSEDLSEGSDDGSEGSEGPHMPKKHSKLRHKDHGSGKVRHNRSIRMQKSEMIDQFYELAQLSACAALVHMSKQCTILESFCSNMFVLESIAEVARDFDSKLHCKCLEILCNIGRLPANNTALTRFPGMFETLLSAGASSDELDRVWALRTLQNMSSDAASKATLATSTMLTLLINCVTSKVVDEQHAAMATLLNLSTDPSAVVPITSTKNVLATLVYLAHNAESTSEIRLMACNALATVGLWLQTVSGFGTIPDEVSKILLPSHKTSGWEFWD